MSSVKLEKRSSAFNQADGNKELITKQADSNGKDFYKVLFLANKLNRYLEIGVALIKSFVQLNP